MTPDEFKKILEDDRKLVADQFAILAELNRQIYHDADIGRDLLIRALEKKNCFSNCQEMLNELVEKTGLFPYLEKEDIVSTSDQIAYEFHRPIGLDDIVLHSEQMEAYQRLLNGENIILSAPTSFGKSLLIDAMIASNKFHKIVIIVPTIALIDETRRRLTARFSNRYKIITHASQAIEDLSIFVLTQERFLEFDPPLSSDFFVIDEFYKLHSGDYDERTVSLNSALLKLCNSSAQFLLIGPNIQNVHSGDCPIQYGFIRTDFKTVATDTFYKKTDNALNECVSLCREINEPTLIFCKSPNSAYELAHFMIDKGITYPSQKAQLLAQWLRDNYHPKWEFAKFIAHGIAVHHGSLPRSISHYLIKLFNDGAIRFLLCTSTMIEGVNTSAKNIIIYDNKIATKKFDYFTFNNIKGRSGRMFQHFVGRVFLLNKPPSDELPFIDIPAWSVPDDIPLTLSLEMSPSRLSDKTIEQLKLLHAQNYLGVSVIQKNVTIPAEFQINAAKEITDNIPKYRNLLCWNQFPNPAQLQTICSLIFDFLMNKQSKDDIVSSSQLNYKIRNLQHLMPNGIIRMIENELANKDFCKTPTIAVEKTLNFLRKWGEYNFPKYLNAIDDIQKYVLKKNNVPSGDYHAFLEEVKHWFLPVSATFLEEYGIPFQVTLKIEKQTPLGDTPDQIISTLKKIKIDEFHLSPIEASILSDALEYL